MHRVRLGMIEFRPAGFKAEIGYVLARRFWGQGYMAEAVRMLVTWAIAQREIDRVWAVCDVENLSSAKVLEKLDAARGVAPPLHRSSEHQLATAGCLVLCPGQIAA